MRPGVYKEHPRVCGENDVEGDCLARVTGTSPRMRGKQLALASKEIGAGNIPAYAGKTGFGLRLGLGCGEHPRVCGENLDVLAPWWRDAGTSPRMRGKPGRREPYAYRRGNIPAYAGKTNRNNHMYLSYLEHPRVCGENGKASASFMTEAGTSPRMRGKR